VDRFFWRSLAIGSIAGGLLAVAGTTFAQEVQQTDSPQDQLNARVVDANPTSNAMEAQARVTAKRKAQLSVEMPGRVEAVLVSEGDSFKEGDVLVELSCGLERANMKKATANLREAEEIHGANERLAELRSVGDLELALSRVRVTGAEADVAVAAARVDRCSLRAPFDGVLAKRHKREAEYIRVGEPLLDVVDPGALEVEFLASSTWLAWLDLGAPFVLHLNELPLQIAGELSQIGVRVDPVSRTVRLKGKLSGDLRGVVPGMSGVVRFEVQPGE